MGGRSALGKHPLYQQENKNLKEQILDMEKQIAFYKDRLQSLGLTFTYASEISQITFPVRPEQQEEHIQEQQCAQREVDNRQEQPCAYVCYQQQPQSLEAEQFSDFCDTDVLDILSPLFRPSLYEGAKQAVDMEEVDMMDFDVSEDHEMPMM